MGRLRTGYLLVIAFLLSTLSWAQEPELDFAALGATFNLARTGKSDVAVLDGEQLYQQHCAQLRVGMFELAYPRWQIAEKGSAEEFRGVVSGIIAVQKRWAEVLAVPASLPEIQKNCATLEAWVKTWKPAACAKVAQHKPEESHELYSVLGASEEVRKAAQNLERLLMNPETCGQAPQDGAPVRILFAPKRKDFAQMMGFIGRLDASLQPVLWNRDATGFTSFWIGTIFVLALEYPPWVFDPKFETGLSMNRFEKNGQLQHTLREALSSLHWACFGDPGDRRYFLQSQALLLTIDVCGEANALEGDGERGTSGAQTQPYEKFVPGGDPNGGTLPPIPAAPFDSLRENHWREGKGADHFALPLRKGQKAAQKAMIKDRPTKMDPELARDPNAHFLLITADGIEKFVVSAPFFGAATANKPYPPQPLLVDYREFFRSYRTAFFHWLATGFDPKNPALCAEKRRELARKVAARDSTQSFEALVAEVYGVPLSGENGAKPSLEWRFLEWLGKGK